MSNYSKHNIYWGAYHSSEDFKELPDAQLIVQYYLGEDDEGGNFSTDIPTNSICLILEDANFWPVISFLDRDEALNLAQRLINAATNTRIIGHA